MTAIKISKPYVSKFRALGEAEEEERIVVEVRGMSSYPHLMQFETMEGANQWVELAKRTIACLLLSHQIGTTGTADTEDMSLVNLMGGRN